MFTMTPAIDIFGITISESTTTITDYLITIVATWLGIRLLQKPADRRHPSHWLWALAFLFIGLAALLGGTSHGFVNYLDQESLHLIWKGMVYCVGFSMIFAIAGTIEGSPIGRSSARLLHVLNFLTFFAYATWMYSHSAFVYVIYYYVPAMISVALIQGWAYFRHKAPAATMDHCRSDRHATRRSSPAKRVQPASPLQQQRYLPCHPDRGAVSALSWRHPVSGLADCIADDVAASYVSRMKKLTGKVVSVHSGSNDDLSKEEHESIQVELDGIVGDRHRGYIRECWPGDKQPEGSSRRNERQWSAVSTEELAEIAAGMNAAGPITPATVGANLCIEGIPQLSRLPKGTLLRFPAGTELIVEEYNPPCKDMSEIQGRLHGSSETAFSKASKLTRGIVGVVEAAGAISAGDDVTVVLYETPSWLARDAD